MSIEERLIAIAWLVALSFGLVVTLDLPAAFSVLTDTAQLTWQLAVTSVVARGE
jgi:hypothetical protein